MSGFEPRSASPEHSFAVAQYKDEGTQEDSKIYSVLRSSCEAKGILHGSWSLELILLKIIASKSLRLLNLCFITYEVNSLGFPGSLNHLSYVEVFWEYENHRCEALWVGTNLEVGALSSWHWIHLTWCVTVLLQEIHSQGPWMTVLKWECPSGGLKAHRM